MVRNSLNTDKEFLVIAKKRVVLCKTKCTIRFCFQMCVGQVLCLLGSEVGSRGSAFVKTRNAPVGTSGAETMVYMFLFTKGLIGWR